MTDTRLTTPLTRRQREVFALAVQGWKFFEIAHRLRIRPNSVSRLAAHACRKLGVSDLFYYGLRRGFWTPAIDLTHKRQHRRRRRRPFTIAEPCLFCGSPICRFPSLTPQERRTLKLVATGLSSRRIGAVLHLSPRTVEQYRARIQLKLTLIDPDDITRFVKMHGLEITFIPTSRHKELANGDATPN
jgi:DNA-binding CsgD family transcriptional regulator